MKKFRKNKKFSWPQIITQNTVKPMISTTVDMDPISTELAQAFDYEWNGTTTFEPWPVPDLPAHYSLGVIAGPSGTGKTLLLNHFGTPEPITWQPHRSIASHFPSPAQARERLTAVGLNSIPVWMRPYNILSVGEAFRADLARRLQSRAVIDEYTSVVDRNVAKAASVAIRRYIRKHSLSHITIATCHTDVVRWLEPDWFFNTVSGSVEDWRSLRRQRIHLTIHRCRYTAWPAFAPHHYLTAKLHKQAQCYIAFWDSQPVGFVAVLAFPHPRFRGAFREHRLVILPDFQGLGLGPRLSDSIAQLYHQQGRRYYSRTAHPRLGAYRNSSPLWQRTNSSERRQDPEKVITTITDHWQPDTRRICYSHRYIGP